MLSNYNLIFMNSFIKLSHKIPHKGILKLVLLNDEALYYFAIYKYPFVFEYPSTFAFYIEHVFLHSQFLDWMNKS